MNTALVTATLFFFSCNQSPLFYYISKETPPKDPVIQGAPSQIVPFSEKLYAANGRIWVYDGTSWTKLPTQPDGNIREIAATTLALYALGIDGTDETSTSLYKSTDGSNWTKVTNNTSYTFLQGGLFGAKDTLFVGGRNSTGTTAAVLYDNGGSLDVSLGDIAMGDTVPGTLAGAVQLSGDYYIAVTGKGVYSGGAANSIGTEAISGTAEPKYRLNGLIALENQVVAVGSGGYLLKGDSTSGFSEVSGACDTSYPYTGALAVWTDPNNSNNKILLVGRRYSTYTNGYWEIMLDTNGDLPGSVSLKVPGESSPSTVSDKDTYQQSLGQKVINALFQAPGDELGSTLFASTLKEGLWSYRNGEWNAEE